MSSQYQSGSYLRELEDFGAIMGVIHAYCRKFIVVVYGDDSNAWIADFTLDGRTEACHNLDPLYVCHGSIGQPSTQAWLGLGQVATVTRDA
jgi:hypothetical protein